MITIAGKASAAEEYLGSFNQKTYHPVSGNLYSIAPNKLLIKDFVYDGEGPDVFFIVGLKGGRQRPNLKDGIPVVPQKGFGAPAKVYSVKDKDIPILRRYDGVDVELTLPGDIKVGDILWLSAYCRNYDVDFGSVLVKDSSTNTNLPRTQ